MRLCPRSRPECGSMRASCVCLGPLASRPARAPRKRKKWGGGNTKGRQGERGMCLKGPSDDLTSSRPVTSWFADRGSRALRWSAGSRPQLFSVARKSPLRWGLPITGDRGSIAAPLQRPHDRPKQSFKPAPREKQERARTQYRYKLNARNVPHLS